MATQPQLDDFNIEEQLVRIRRAREESEKFSAEARKLDAERIMYEQERFKIEIERLKIAADMNFMPRTMVFQAMIAAAALLGAGAAIAKLFFR